MRKGFRIIKSIIIISLSMLILIVSAFLIIPKTQKIFIGLVGFSLTLYGFNETGPKVSKIALNEKYKLTGKDFRSFSVQNTKNGNYDIAVDALKKAIILDESYKDYYAWVLLYYYRDYERAYTLLQEYDDLTPNFSDHVVGENVNYLKGLALLRMNKFEEAITEFDKYIENVIFEAGEKWVDVYAFVNKGIALANLGRYNSAIDEYDRAIKNYELCTEAYYYKSIALFEENRMDLALECAEYSYELVSKGQKHQDNYVELFHEIYSIQTERMIEKIKKGNVSL